MDGLPLGILLEGRHNYHNNGAGIHKKTFRRDAALMDILHESEDTTISTSLSNRINRCRLWLKVKFVSELFDPSTNVILPWARSGDNIPYA